MIISVCCMPESVSLTVIAAAEISRQTVDQMVDQIMTLPEGTKIQLLAPVVRGRKESMSKCWNGPEGAVISGCIDGNLYELTEEIKLEKNIKHYIEIVVDGSLW